MKDRISALMDGALDDKSASDLIGNLARDPEAIEAWRRYHTIGDLMRGSAPLSDGFAARVAWKLADEPTVLAPGRMRPAQRLWLTASAVAASVAAVAMVGWVALAPQPASDPTPPVAQAQPPALVPLPTAANDYLLAHQGFSPRISLAPYVRTVADHREARR